MDFTILENARDRAVEEQREVRFEYICAGTYTYRGVAKPCGCVVVENCTVRGRNGFGWKEHCQKHLHPEDK